MVNKFSDVPLYAQLKNIIIQKIQDGEYAENSQIPSEQELCEIYNISRPTVRQAISDLTSSGYLKKEKGRGTFVRKNSSAVDLKNYSGFHDSIIDGHITGNREVVSASIVSSSKIDKKIADAFEVQKNNYHEFAEVKYSIKENNEVVGFNVSYVPASLFPGIIDDLADKKPGHEILKGRYPLVPAKSKTTMEVTYTENGDSINLNLQPGQPVVKIENQIISKGGMTVEYVISKYRSDRCKFSFENAK